jgi:hypothetical protein
MHPARGRSGLHVSLAEREEHIPAPILFLSEPFGELGGNNAVYVGRCKRMER